MQTHTELMLFFTCLKNYLYSKHIIHLTLVRYNVSVLLNPAVRILNNLRFIIDFNF